jgi:hypothetical protein
VHVTTPAGTAPNTGLTMPRREITRTQARRRRIHDERRLNEIDLQRRLLDTVPPF